jgi:hypothetical protein
LVLSFIIVLIDVAIYEAKSFNRTRQLAGYLLYISIKRPELVGIVVTGWEVLGSDLSRDN